MHRFKEGDPVEVEVQLGADPHGPHNEGSMILKGHYHGITYRSGFGAELDFTEHNGWEHGISIEDIIDIRPEGE